MIVVLVHWHIKNESVPEFLFTWKEKMKPIDDTGLYYEILTEVNTKEASDPRYHSLDLENPHYVTFVNIGIWRDLNDFERAIGGFLPPTQEIIDKKSNELKVQILMSKYEYKLRDRIVLDIKELRKGALSFDITQGIV